MKVTANLPLTRAEWSEQRLQQFLPKAPSPVVSDIGTGFGWMQDVTERSGGVWQGFDQILKAPGVRLWNLDHAAPCDVTRPGIVLMLEVLEHLWNPELALRNVAEHLLPGGYLVMTSPNPGWSRSRAYALHHGVPFSFTPRHVAEHHVFTTWPHIVEHLLESKGFEILEYVTLSQKVADSHTSGPVDYLKTVGISVLCRIIERIDGSARGPVLGIVARRSL